MIFFPIGTDRQLKRTPWVNYALILANICLFILTANDIDLVSKYYYALSNIVDKQGAIIPNEPDILYYYLNPGDGRVFQYFSYQFLHASWMHLIMNMIFLYVFGNAVEDRLGKVGYLLFYLAGGVVAGLVHGLVETNPVLGASGSVSAVTGAYLALFPLSYVTIVYWFVLFGSFEISSILLILFQVAQDALFHVGNVGNTAYLAHLGGYFCGFTLGMFLLLARIIPRETYDLLYLIEHKRRRALFKKLSEGGYRPWDHNKPGDPPGKGDTPEVTEQEAETMQARAAISAALADHQLPKAADLYADLLKQHPDQVMGKQQQLDLANQLMSEGKYALSASAYQLFLVTYKNYADREQVQLILGLIFARYLDQRQRAKELLTEAVPRLHGDELALARQVLEEIG